MTTSERTVLYLEDHDDTAEMMALMLRLVRLNVTRCKTIASAKQQLEQGHFDLLISDIGLADGNGLDFIRWVRGLGLTMPAVALSGFVTESDVSRAIESGFQAHLTKPVELHRLRQVITAVLEPAPRP